jgi:predicted lactoylglutathione lyase
MDQRVSLITLGVTDLARSKAFYEALGWRGQEVQETVFFQTGGSAVVLWARENVAPDGNLPDPHPEDGFGGIVLAHNTRSREEVDAVMTAAAAAGATITKPAQETFYGGYAGFFTDLDGHAWEIAHNPGFTLTESGDLILPNFGGSQEGA